METLEAPVLEKKKDLTFKQAKFLKILNKTGNPTEAAMQAYDCEDRRTASVIASQNLSKLNVTMRDLMDKMGLTDEKILGKIDEGLEATRTISAISSKQANGQTQDFIDVPDYHVRHKYTETALKLKGHLREADNQPPQINIFLGSIVDRADKGDFIDIEKSE